MLLLFNSTILCVPFLPLAKRILIMMGSLLENGCYLTTRGYVRDDCPARVYSLPDQSHHMLQRSWSSRPPVVSPQHIPRRQSAGTCHHLTLRNIDLRGLTHCYSALECYISEGHMDRACKVTTTVSSVRWHRKLHRCLPSSPDLTVNVADLMIDPTRRADDSHAYCDSDAVAVLHATFRHALPSRLSYPHGR